MNISTGVEKIKKRKRFLAFLLSAMVTVYLIGVLPYTHLLQMTEPLKIPPPKTR